MFRDDGYRGVRLTVAFVLIVMIGSMVYIIRASRVAAKAGSATRSAHVRQIDEAIADSRRAMSRSNRTAGPRQ